MKYFGWIFLFFVLIYILPLGSRPLMLIEYPFSETAREMVISRDYVTPKLRGGSRLEAPAPAYYPAAKSIQLFGKNGFSVRFPGALAAGITALFIWILMQQTLRDEKLAALAAIIYLSFSAVFLSGTFASEASLYAMLVVGGCGTMFSAMQEEKLNRRKILNIILSGAFIGLAFLVGGFKGIIIPAAAGIVYMIWDRKLKQLPVILIFTLLLAGAVILPWALAINRAEPGFWRYFVMEVTRDEFGLKGCAPWYLPFAFFVFGAFPAALLIPAAGVVGKEAWKGFLRQPLYRFAFCFLLPVLVLSAFNRSWNVMPVLPAFAPLAVLIAAGVRYYFNSGGHHRSYNWMMTVWGAFLLLAGAGLAACNFIRPAVLFMVPLSWLFYPVVGGALIFAGAVMVYSVTGNWRGRLYLFFFGIGLVMFFLPWFFRGNFLMPGEVLSGIREQYDTKTASFPVVCETVPLANAAAWELERSNVWCGNIEGYTGKVLKIDRKYRFFQSGNFDLNVAMYNNIPAVPAEKPRTAPSEQ